MSKNTRTRILLTAVAALLLVTMAVGGTLAWLTDSTATIINTFTESDVDIDLTETLPANKTAKMVPGTTIDKNPAVEVKAGSEACYVFVKIEKSTNKAFDDYLTYTIAEGWTEIGNTGVYWRQVDAATAADGEAYDVLAGNKVSVKKGVTKEMMDELTSANYPTLTFTAYAVQSANLDVTDISDIWALAQTDGAAN